MAELFAITIGDNLIVDKYLDNYSVNIIERYATDTNFTSISGKNMNKYLGDRRELSVNFEPMETNQLNQLVKAIKKHKNDIPINYNDPQFGNITKRFSCNTLPTATYFVSDDNRKFWTIPTVVFSETDESASENDEDDEGEKWHYRITIEGITYNDDEISNNTSISVSAGSSGFSVGECCSSTITGSLLYKGGELSVKKNTVLTLYCDKEFMGVTENILKYKWFIKSFNVENKNIIHFSAVDAMAFADNDYPMENGARVASHIEAAQETISELAQNQIAISQPPFSQYYEVINQSGWSVRTLLNYASVYGAVNYAALFNINKTSNEDDFKIFTIDSSTTLGVSQDNYSNLSVGIIGAKIEQIRVSQTDMQDPRLEEGMTYEDFGIYYLSKIGKKSNVLNLVCPWVEDNIKSVGDLYGKIGESYGTEFSCDNVKVGELYPPYIQIKFAGFEDYTFYISNASYKLTSIGIYASISGDTKSLSDFEYIGKTETELKTKVALNMGYQSGFISQENGIYWDDSAIQEVVNSD